MELLEMVFTYLVALFQQFGNYMSSCFTAASGENDAFSGCGHFGKVNG